MSSQDFIDLSPLISAQGDVVLPGSKSISNRTLLLAALAEGETVVRDLLLSDDTQRMLEALDALGVKVERLAEHDFRVVGCGGDFPLKQAELFLGNAGTAFRPLTAALALSGGEYQLSGVARMHERPIGDLVEALRELGVRIDYLANDGFPPLKIHPSTINEIAQIRVRGDVSSQFLTALLMAMPLLGRDIAIDVVGELISKPYIEITLAMMARFGVEVRRDGWQRFTVVAGSSYRSPGEIYVEGDASSASYFLAAGLIGGGPVKVEGAGRLSVQGDIRFADALEQMGAKIEWGGNWIRASRPQGLDKLKALQLDGNHIPDAAMTLAVLALFADGNTTLKNIASWRVKETDRIAAMATELRKIGAIVEEGEDYLTIWPPQDKSLLNPEAGIDTYDDHRMAMCFSLAAFAAPGIRINDPGCVAKTFPDYFESFRRVVIPVPVIAIDGPSASGKGTVAQGVAQRLGYHYLDSGALYRLLGLAALDRGVALDDEVALAALALALDIHFADGQALLDGRNVGDSIRTEQVAAAASTVAALPRVRAALLAKQREFRRVPGLVTDGRDMGSVVFPDADLKVFLTASAEIRAERRYKQLKQSGIDANIPHLLQDIRSRDERDQQRSVAPLQKNNDAKLLDTDALTAEQAIEQLVSLFRQ